MKRCDNCNTPVTRNWDRVVARCIDGKWYRKMDNFNNAPMSYNAKVDSVFCDMSCFKEFKNEKKGTKCLPDQE